VSSNLDRYERIAPLYDLLDLPFEYSRYRKIRPLHGCWMRALELVEIFSFTHLGPKSSASISAQPCWRGPSADAFRSGLALSCMRWM
jgi:hypothetical protein